MGKKNKPATKKQISAEAPPKKKLIREKQPSMIPWLLLVMTLTGICFLPIFQNGFTNWDDEFYVLNNAMIMTPDWKAIFTQPVAANYHPLTMLTFAINYQLSGLSAWSYLLFNLALHLLNVLLVFQFIYHISNKKLWIAFITALVFGIHPMHVESVAWISERKDVLYTFFFLLALIQYWKFLQTAERSRYWLCLLFFTFSLLSKPAAIIFPFVLLLMDYWKGIAINRRRSIIEKLPFFALSLAFGVINLNIQANVAMAGLNVFPFWSRIFFACYGIMIYIIRFFVPYPLSTFHPFPPVNNLGWAVFASPVFVLLLATWVWIKRRNKNIVFGMLFYVVNLLLVLQIMSVGLTIISERYTYVPYIGLAFLVAWFLNKTTLGQKKIIAVGLPVLVAIVFGYFSFAQTSVWKNSGTLWTNAIRYAPDSEYPRTNRAHYTISQAKRTTDTKVADSLYKQALEDCNVALARAPRHIPSLQNRINICMRLGLNQQALQDADLLSKIDPKNPAAHLSKGILYARMNQVDNAKISLDEAILLNPNSDVALDLRGTLLVDNFQRFSEALSDFNKAIVLNPSGEYFLHRSICRYRMQDYPKAVEDAKIALQKGAAIPDSYRKLVNL